ncbi:MAG TPA: hypothetical protein DCF68_01390, partial [Cyanothece sp. UBA12306]|nr:hypothetical protein [Cyanothece sp. UBA12306]
MATISISDNITADSGSQVMVPVMMDDTSSIQSVDITLQYDPNIITALGVQKGSLLSELDDDFENNNDWTIRSNNENPGEIIISAFSATPLDIGSAGELFIIVFDAIAEGNSILDLTEGSVGIGGQDVSQTLDDGEITVGDTMDNEDPIVTPGQTFEYAENQAENFVIGTVEATDNVGVIG